jgi:aminoglycoside 6'-N-acetyltransferase
LTSLGDLFADAEIRGDLTVVRPAGEADADLLVAWHADPEVARYWDDETFTREEMLERLRRGEVASFIVEENDEPVGYLQVWREGDEAGLDMFLIPAARGRSLGPDAGRAVARYLRDECGWARLTVDPYLWNEPAVSAWERAGFRPVDEREPDAEHTARWLLMEFADD